MSGFATSDKCTLIQVAKYLVETSKLEIFEFWLNSYVKLKLRYCFLIEPKNEVQGVPG